jgi:cytochrome c-type biogenesis protein
MFDPDWVVSFVAGLLTPLGAVCVLPLYPGYISFLAGPGDAVRGVEGRLLLGMVTAAGILAAMFLFGLVVVFLFSYPLSGALSIISPLAYLILGIMGALLILDVFPDLPVPAPRMPGARMPFMGAFLFGLFFGILILPCNAAPIVVLLAISTSTTDTLANMLNFVFFGVGMALPLIAISVLSAYQGKSGTAFLVRHRRAINVATGMLMLAVALYYLFSVLRIQDAGFPL